MISKSKLNIPSKKTQNEIKLGPKVSFEIKNHTTLTIISVG
jgi:hypothetical protein